MSQPSSMDIRVPRVVGLLLGEAEQELLIAGLRPVIVWDCGPGEDALGIGYVFDQNPAGGDRVPLGSIVRIHSWFETEREVEAWDERVRSYVGRDEPIFNAFICHAWEDRDIAREIGLALRQQGARVWLDEFVLRVGDSIRQKIDDGLRKSKFGVVLISMAFFDKGWANYELDGILQMHMVAAAQGGKVVLPVWVDVNYQQVMNRAPSLAAIYAARLADGKEKVIQDLLWGMRDPVIDSHILTPAQQSDLENAARWFVKRNAREGLQFELIDFRYVHEPRGGWWATCLAQQENRGSALVLMYMSPGGGWSGIDLGSGIELYDYPLPGPLMPRWW